MTGSTVYGSKIRLRLSGKEPQYRLIDDAELHLTIYAATPDRAGWA